jgi:NADH-quinone oxidoreductase subunit C
MGADVFDRLRGLLGQAADDATVEHGLLVLRLAPAAVLVTAQTLKERAGFDMLLDVTAIDWPQRVPRFDVVWHFYSTLHRVRVRLRTAVAEDEPVVDTLTTLYGSAHYAERECHEMYGIAFRGNADLRPILLYEGFVGHPLLKDYPKRGEQPLVAYRPGFDPAQRTG